MIWLGILILFVIVVIGYIIWRLDSIHNTLIQFRRDWILVHRKELAEGEEWELLSIKNDLMSRSKVRTLDEKIRG